MSYILNSVTEFRDKVRDYALGGVVANASRKERVNLSIALHQEYRNSFSLKVVQIISRVASKIPKNAITRLVSMYSA